MKKTILTVLFLSAILLGCVSKKKYNRQLGEYTRLRNIYDSCLTAQAALNDTVARLHRELDDLRERSNMMLNQLTDLSVITKSQAESIKKSLDALSAKDTYINKLQVEMARKDSLNMALVMNLKGALKDEKDEDVQVKVEGSAVFISLSDKMLFKSGSYQISPRAKEVLGKVADILKAQPDIQFMVEGHTDNKPISNSCIKDNWDLSVLRATAIVRLLQKDFQVDPARIIAAGRGEYLPLTDNNSAENRAINRRTRIMIIPQLDQFFKLLEPKEQN